MEDIRPSENAEALEVASLLGKIADNPYQYEVHVAYIAVLRKGGATDDLHQARLFFHSCFPFSEGISSIPEGC